MMRNKQELICLRVSVVFDQETVFEIGTKGKAGHSEAAEVMRKRRQKIIPRRRKEDDEKISSNEDENVIKGPIPADDNEDDDMGVVITGGDNDADIAEASDGELEVTFSKSAQKGKGRTLKLSLWLFPQARLIPTGRISQYAHSAWRMQDGPFGSAPNTITQTTDGYVWIGTMSGISRFDGVRFVSWACH